MNNSKTGLGATTMAMASALRVLIQIAVLPIIGRLLGPHAYGEVALVSPFVFFSMMLAESGLGACIVRADRVTAAMEGTIFTFSAGLSLIFIALFAALAWPLGQFLHEPSFPPLLLGMSSILLLASLNIVPGSLLLREKKYHWIAISDVASSVGGLAGVILGIALGWGAWSLVAQQVGFWIAKLIVVFWASRAPPRFIFSTAVLKENFHFGSRLTASGIVSFFARNIDNVLIGKFMGPVLLGYYALAFQIVSIPQMVFSGSVYFTVFASTSESVRKGLSPWPEFLSMLRGVSLISFPVIAGLAATANLSVPIVLGEKWSGTIDMIVLLAPFGAFQTIGAAISGLINGLGKANLGLKIGFFTSVSTILAILVGVTISSTAVAIAVSITAFLYPAIALHSMVMTSGLKYRDVVQQILAPTVSSIAMGTLVFSLQFLFNDESPPIIRLGICIVVGIVIYPLILVIVFRDHIRDDLIEIKRILKPRTKG